MKPGDIVEIAQGDYTPEVLAPAQSGTPDAALTIRLAMDDKHNGHVHLAGLSFGRTSWVTVSGALRDSFTLSPRVSDLEAITNNIGLHIRGRATGIHVTGPNTGLRVLWTHVYECGAEGKPNENAVHLADTQTSCEIGYCWFQDNIYGDTFNYPRASPAWGDVSIHDCLVYNTGDDAFQMNGGFDVYRCIIQHRTWGQSSGHTDCFQTWGRKIRIHHNIIRNFSAPPGGSKYNSIAYAQFSTPVSGDFLFYNNLIYDDDKERLGAPGLMLTFDAWWSPAKHNDHVVITNVFIANNLFCKPAAQNVAWTLHGRSDPHRGTNDSYTITNCLVANNIFLDGYSQTPAQRQGVVVGLPAPVKNNPAVDVNEQSLPLVNNIVAGRNPKISYLGRIWNDVALAGRNVGFSNWTAMPAFKSYAYLAPKPDFRLENNDTAARDKGQNLDRFTNSIPMLNVDLDGNTRGANGAWDIGPYEVVE